MNVCRLVISLLSILFIGPTVTAAELSHCLSLVAYQEHRLEKEDSIRYCFNKYKISISKETCYSSLATRVPKLASTKLTEEINSICFYETPTAKNINSCLNETKKFKNALNHDEAIFYCYQQFQEKLSKAECLKTAEELIYPLKKEYLKQYCNNSI